MSGITDPTEEYFKDGLWGWNGTCWQKVKTDADGNLMVTFAESAYPVGSIYLSVVATNPSVLFGFGTWVAFGAGRVIVGLDAGQAEFDVVEEVGGAKTHTLTAAQSGLPSHKHPIQAGFVWSPGGSQAIDTSSGYAAGAFTGNVTAADASNAHNNLQPYIVVYMWKRTA